MKVQIDAGQLLDFLKEELNIDEVKAKVGEMKNIDFNPFDDDGDEYVGFKQEMQHNGEIISGAVTAVIGLVERIVVGGISLNGAQKREMAIKMLDDAIKLPFYLEPFDGIAIGMLIDLGVVQMNKVDWGDYANDPLVIPPNTGIWEEIG